LANDKWAIITWFDGRPLTIGPNDIDLHQTMAIPQTKKQLRRGLRQVATTGGNFGSLRRTIVEVGRDAGSDG
jgi:hypothetical protein